MYVRGFGFIHDVIGIVINVVVVLNIFFAYRSGQKPVVGSPRKSRERTPKKKMFIEKITHKKLYYKSLKI